MSANLKLVPSSCNRELSAKINPDYQRNYSLNSRESPKVPIIRQASMEELDKQYKSKHLLRMDSQVPEILSKYPTPLISPDKYLKKFEEVMNKHNPSSRSKPMNKIGMMIIDSPKPPTRALPALVNPSHIYKKDLNVHYLPSNLQS